MRGAQFVRKIVVRWLLPALLVVAAVAASLVLVSRAVPEPRVEVGLAPSLATPEPGAGESERGRRWNQLGRLALIAARDDQERERAVALLERAVAEAPDDDEFQLDLAEAYGVLGRDLTWAAATDLYEQVLARRPDDQQLLGRLVRAYTELGNAPQAYQYAERRLELVPAAGAYDVALQAVAIVAAGGDPRRGTQLVRGALAKNPDHKGMQLLLASVLAETGGRVEARALVERLLERATPDDPYRTQGQKLLASMEGRP